MKNQISTVNVPTSTLNAIKSLLFSEKEGGVDLSPIVADLAVGDTCEDLIAINVGLTFKGIRPNIDTTTRYVRDYQSLVEYTFVGYSMIRDIVTYQKRTIAKWDEKVGDLIPCANNKDFWTDTASLEQWYRLDTDRSVPTIELVNRWKKEDKQ